MNTKFEIAIFLYTDSIFCKKIVTSLIRNKILIFCSRLPPALSS